MDILELLSKEHSKLRSQIEDIHQHLEDPSLHDRVRNFISSFELHESIEEEILFPKLYSLPGKVMHGHSIFDYEHLHTKIWELLDRLVAVVDEGKLAQSKKAFLTLAATTRAHFRYEEENLFPAIRAALEPGLLEELGRLAEKELDRFSPALGR